MRVFLRISIPVLIGLVAVGCGGKSGKIKASGRVVKDGAAFVPTDGAGLRIFFNPLDKPPPDTKTYESYVAVFDAKTGGFEVKGKDGEGLPPGKYQVGLELMKHRDDVWGGKLMGAKSPFTFDVVSGKEIVINLDEAKLE
jgi:hypothetical protein